MQKDSIVESNFRCFLYQPMSKEMVALNRAKVDRDERKVLPPSSFQAVQQLVVELMVKEGKYVNHNLSAWFDGGCFALSQSCW